MDDEDDESDDVSVRLEATSPAMLKKKKKKKKYVNEDGEEWRNSCRQQKKGIIALSMHIIKKADNSMLIYFS